MTADERVESLHREVCDLRSELLVVESRMTALTDQFTRVFLDTQAQIDEIHSLTLELAAMLAALMRAPSPRVH